MSACLKLISVCLIIDSSLITDLHIFVYGSAEYATISLECTKVKLIILNNFVCGYQYFNLKVQIHLPKKKKNVKRFNSQNTN